MTTRRQICLLGSFLATLDGEAVTQFGSDTARALLAYLVLHPGIPLRRDALAGLLWPEHTDAEARRNLRVALSRLRAAMGDRELDADHPDEPLLQVDRQAILFPDDARCFVDVGAMRGALAETRTHAHERLERCGECADRLRQAVDLYRGEFLAGFSLDSVPFEEWMVVERESLHWQALEALAALADYYESQGNYEAAIENARRQIELESWRETAHQQCMRALAASGHRGAALAQYEACRQILAEELGVEPEPATLELQARIRSGTLVPAERVLPPPPAKAPDPAEPPVQTKPPAPVSPPVQGALPSVPGRALAQPEGERRTVTVLSVRFVGGGAAEQSLDPELWSEEVGEALGHALAVVGRYGGEVSQVRADGLVVLFGAGAAHEDDPERAVLAALAIEQAIQGKGELQVRAGVHTGEAVVPRIGDGRQPHVATALGTVVPVADQIARAAEPGTIFVDEQTTRLARPFFEWEARGKMGLLGGQATTRVYRPLARVTQEDVLRGKGRGIAGLESPLVGRDAEVDALRQALDSLRAGIGGIVTLVGEAGIGKSRLVAEVRQSANLKWLEGRCLSYTETEAYRLWVDVLRALLGVATDATATIVRDTLRDCVHALCDEGAGEVYPFLARLMALPLEEEDRARLHGLDAGDLRVLTFRAWETLLDRAASQHALVLVCEDLHWADPTSLALLEHLLPLAERVPLLYICVFRPLTDHGCWQIRELAAREFRHLHTDLWLEALTEGQSGELVGHLLRPLRELREDMPQTLRVRILEHAEGNPFYVEEILRSLIDGGVLFYDEPTGRWRASMDLDDLPLPDTLRGVLTARFDRLPLAARHVLRLASVVGRIFQRRVLESLVQGASELDENLRALQRAQMIRRRPDLPRATYIFKHQLTQEAAYESLLRRKRRDLHRRVAQTLEQLYPGRVEERLGLLAHHWERAGDVERAVSYLRRAGEQAAAQFANAEAAAYLGRALDLTPEDDWLGRYALLLSREQVHNVQGEREAQAQDLAALQELALLLGDSHRAEVAVRRAHHAVMVTDYAAAIAAAQLATRLGEAAGDVQSQASGHRHWGRAFRRQGMYEEAQAHYKCALALARGAGLRREEAYCLRQLGNTCDDPAQATAYHEQALHLFRQIGDRRGEGMSLRDLGSGLMFQGQSTQVQRYFEQSLQVCRKTGDRRDEGWALFFLGHCFLLQGELEAAADYYGRCLPLMRDTDPMGEAQALLYVGWVCLRWGDYARAQAFLERSLHAGREIGFDEEATALAGLAIVSYHLGDREGGRAYVQRARQVFYDPERHLFAAWTILGHALFYLGHLVEAADTYLHPMALPQTITGLAWAREILAGQARIHLAQGEPEAALACVEEILDQIETDPIFPFTLEPLQIYLTCYRVLCANADSRAGPLLRAAYDLLQEQALKIDDPALRRSFLENVAAHREIVALYTRAL